jgi:hypothetical protein
MPARAPTQKRRTKMPRANLQAASTTFCSWFAQPFRRSISLINSGRSITCASCSSSSPMNFRETDRSLQVAAGCRREAKTGGRKEQRALPETGRWKLWGRSGRDRVGRTSKSEEMACCEHFVLALAEIGLFGRPLPPLTRWGKYTIAWSLLSRPLYGNLAFHTRDRVVASSMDIMGVLFLGYLGPGWVRVTPPSWTVLIRIMLKDSRWIEYLQVHAYKT